MSHPEEARRRDGGKAQAEAVPARQGQMTDPGRLTGAREPASGHRCQDPDTSVLPGFANANHNICAF